MIIFERSKKGHHTGYIRDQPISDYRFPDSLKRSDIGLPELSEPEIVRHFSALAQKNFGVDNGFYPLGSCTMKYNPKISEGLAALEELSDAHPYSDESFIQGSLEIMYGLQDMLKNMTAMDDCTLQPAAGAHGELTGLMIAKKYFQGQERKVVLAPDSAHGTNPASSSMCNFDTRVLRTDKKGRLDIESLKENLDSDVAAVMLTIPNTLGIFEKDILEIARLVHANGSLVYMDGANMNALLGKAMPGLIGIDILHLNLHKTFASPHGCGGPGSGPVLVKGFLSEFLPVPKIRKKENKYYLDYDIKESIGKVKAFYGNFPVLLKAYCYILAIGKNGLNKVSDHSVVNANYLKAHLKGHYNMKYDSLSKHEFVLDDSNMPNDVTTEDIAKRLVDYGIHPPTIYFPLIVPGAMMIEPTETENKETLNHFIDAMKRIKKEAEENPRVLKDAPHTTPVRRVDQVAAARSPVLKSDA